MPGAPGFKVEHLAAEGSPASSRGRRRTTFPGLGPDALARAASRQGLRTAVRLGWKPEPGEVPVQPREKEGSAFWSQAETQA